MWKYTEKKEYTFRQEQVEWAWEEAPFYYDYIKELSCYLSVSSWYLVQQRVYQIHAGYQI